MISRSVSFQGCFNNEGSFPGPVWNDARRSADTVSFLGTPMCLRGVFESKGKGSGRGVKLFVTPDPVRYASRIGAGISLCRRYYFVILKLRVCSRYHQILFITSLAATTPDIEAWISPRVTPAPSPAAKRFLISVSSPEVSFNFME